MTTPEMSREELPNWQETIGGPLTATSVAYHGLIARISELRAGRAADRIARLDHRAEFFETLGTTAENVVDERLPHSLGRNIGHTVLENMPSPPIVQNPLAAQAKSHERMSILRSTGSPLIEDKPRPLDLSDLAGTLGQPLDRKERRTQKRVIKGMRSIRHDRKTQSSDRKMYGASGTHAGLLSKIAHFKDRQNDRRDYRNGFIDNIELQEGKLRRARSEVVISPFQMRKRNLRLGKTEESVIENSRGLAEKARTKSDKQLRREARFKVAAQRHRQNFAQDELQDFDGLAEQHIQDTPDTGIQNLEITDEPRHIDQKEDVTSATEAPVIDTKPIPERSRELREEPTRRQRSSRGRGHTKRRRISNLERKINDEVASELTAMRNHADIDEAEVDKVKANIREQFVADHLGITVEELNSDEKARDLRDRVYGSLN